MLTVCSIERNKSLRRRPRVVSSSSSCRFFVPRLCVCVCVYVGVCVCVCVSHSQPARPHYLHGMNLAVWSRSLFSIRASSGRRARAKKTKTKPTRAATAANNNNNNNNNKSDNYTKITKTFSGTLNMPSNNI